MTNTFVNGSEFSSFVQRIEGNQNDLASNNNNNGQTISPKPKIKLKMKDIKN